MISKQIEKEIYDISKDGWLSGFFSAIPSFVKDISFEQHKEIFFELTEKWLKEGLIKFDYPPLDEYAGKEGIWDADNDTVMQYLKDGFPKNATNELDEDVNMYFYLVAPPVNWR